MGRRNRRSRGEGEGAVHGVLLVDKPEGITSAEVVRRIKSRAGGKVGHLGTLDPFATGLLPLCLGEATKIAQFLNAADKEYEGVIALGRSTETGDRTGAALAERPVPPLSDSDLRKTADQLTGDLQQTPPMYSAIKRDGVPLYKLARQGIEVAREARPITVHELDLQIEDEARLRFRVACSKGTYVRVLAQDIGLALDTVAHLEALRRTAFGSFRLDRGAVSPEDWQPPDGAGLLSVREALADLPVFPLPEPAVAAVQRGQVRVLRDLTSSGAERHALLVSPAGAVLAVVERDGDGWRYARVLGTA